MALLHDFAWPCRFILSLSSSKYLEKLFEFKFSRTIEVHALIAIKLHANRSSTSFLLSQSPNKSKGSSSSPQLIV